MDNLAIYWCDISGKCWNPISDANHTRSCVLSDLRWCCYIGPDGLHVPFIYHQSSIYAPWVWSLRRLQTLIQPSSSYVRELIHFIDYIYSKYSELPAPANCTFQSNPDCVCTTSRSASNHRTYPGNLLKSNHLQLIFLGWGVMQHSRTYVAE
jgi:hypothetical protein